MTTTGRLAEVSAPNRVGMVGVLIGFVLLFLLLDRLTPLLAGYDPTAGQIAAGIVLVIAAVGLDMLLFGRALPVSWRGLGFGRPDTRTLVVTAVLGTLMLAFFPTFSWITGASLTVPDRWLWVLAGLFAVHGLAEEVLFRGFAFHNLRTGRTFGRAALLSLVMFAIAHVYLFTYMPVALALFATFLALASAYPLAYLFERGNNTIWAPAIMHTQVHTISFFVVPEALLISAAISWMMLWIVSLAMFYAFRKRLFGSVNPYA